MKRFEVYVSETFGRKVYVETEDYEDFDEASDIVNELCNLDIIYLGDNDFGSREIEVLCEISDNVDNVEFDKVYTRKDIKNGVSEYETDEEIFRRIQMQYRIEDAEMHCEELGYDDLDNDDFEKIADMFLDNYDCNISENEQFENVIRKYILEQFKTES